PAPPRHPPQSSPEHPPRQPRDSSLAASGAFESAPPPPPDGSAPPSRYPVADLSAPDRPRSSTPESCTASQPPVPRSLRQTAPITYCRTERQARQSSPYTSASSHDG